MDQGQRHQDQRREQKDDGPLNGGDLELAEPDPVPSGVETLSADGLASSATLSGSDVPAFAADFHDALIFGALADENEKLEKPSLSAANEARYAERVNDLKYFIATSAYLVRQQNGGGRSPRWNPRIVPA